MTKKNSPPRKSGFVKTMGQDIQHHVLIPTAMAGSMLAAIFASNAVAPVIESLSNLLSHKDAVHELTNIGTGDNSVSQAFDCATIDHRCTMDMGDGTLLSFATITDFQAADQFMRTGLKTHYKGAPIPVEVNRGLAVFSLLTQTSYESLLGKVYTESTFNPNAFHASTKARGAFQILPETAMETLYNMHQTGQYPFIPETAIVERHSYKDSKGGTHFSYAMKKGVLEDKVLDRLLNNPTTAAFIADAYTKRYIAQLDLPEGIPLTEVTEYALHWQGPGGAQRLYNAYGNNADQPAYRVFAQTTDAKIIKNNWSMFMNADDTPRSIAEMFAHMEDVKGLSSTNVISAKLTLQPNITFTNYAESPQLYEIRDRFSAAYIPDPNVPLPRADPRRTTIAAILASN